MGLSQAKVEAIKQIATGKDVIFFISDGHTISGKLVDVTTDHVKLESDEEITFLTVGDILAIRIRK